MVNPWVELEVGTQIECLFYSPHFLCSQATAKDLSQSVHLLLQLREPPSSLCSEYLSHAELRLSSQLESLTQLDPSVDILEFVQQSGDGYVNDLCLMISCYNDMFINR